MDRPCSDCRASRRGYLGAYRFRYQEPDSAFPSKNHGYGRPVAAIPWQWTIQRPGSVHFGAGTLLCWNCRRDPELLDTAKTKADSQQAGKGNPNSRSASRSTAVAAVDFASANC